MRNKIFLGGTCAKTNWRDIVIPKLEADYFNPAVSNWTVEDELREQQEKDFKCNVHLYLINNEMKDVYSIAEAVDSAHSDRAYLIFIVILDKFDIAQAKSLFAVGNLIKNRDKTACVKFFSEFDEDKVANLINEYVEAPESFTKKNAAKSCTST